MLKKFKFYNSYNHKELDAVKKIILEGKLSGFIASNSKEFYGGKFVRNFEKKIAQYFKVKYAVSFNSWTSGLIASVGAINIEPGDHVLVPTWTMCASSTSIIHFNAIPVFVDIDPDNFNICIKDLEKKITIKTKAILAVDIFGIPSNVKKIKELAKKYKLKVIYDSAQSIGAKVNNKFVGSFGDVSGFSFNYHKHIHTGEGGVAITNNFAIYKKLTLIRNHGEIIQNKNSSNHEMQNIVGYNFRLGEIEAALGIVQLKKLKKIINFRRYYYNKFFSRIKKLKGIIFPAIPKGVVTSPYIIPIRLSDKLLKKISREKVLKMLKKQGVPGLSAGYMNIHQLEMIKRKLAYGSRSFPWSIKVLKKKYKKDRCPNAEYLHKSSFIGFSLFSYEFNSRDFEKICLAFEKVWKKI